MGVPGVGRRVPVVGAYVPRALDGVPALDYLILYLLRTQAPPDSFQSRYPDSSLRKVSHRTSTRSPALVQPIRIEIHERGGPA